jgi:hypothetical protein
MKQQTNNRKGGQEQRKAYAYFSSVHHLEFLNDFLSLFLVKYLRKIFRDEARAFFNLGYLIVITGTLEETWAVSGGQQLA